MIQKQADTFFNQMFAQNMVQFREVQKEDCQFVVVVLISAENSATALIFLSGSTIIVLHIRNKLL